MSVALGREEDVVEALDHVVVAIVKRAHRQVAQHIVQGPQQGRDAVPCVGSRVLGLQFIFQGSYDHAIELSQLWPRIGVAQAQNLEHFQCFAA